MHDISITRRDSIKLGGAAVAASFMWATTGRADDPSAVKRRRVARIGHLTDFHVQPERRAGEGMTACLRHVQQPAEKPDLILNGGDSIMDAFDADDARVRVQWDLWRKVLRDECSVPVRACIGNHDISGWGKSIFPASDSQSSWGKKLAAEMLELENEYYSFMHAGWQFIVLDSVRPHGYHDYIACLEEEQFDWLTRTLRDTPATTPVLVVSHIPILSTTSIFWSENYNGNFRVKGAFLHSDHVRIKDLFAKHSNVKLCLSGHTHLADRVDYNGVTYLCSGAVSGNWWQGRFKDCDEGYSLIDLYDDGTFEHHYLKYGWQAVS